MSEVIEENVINENQVTDEDLLSGEYTSILDLILDCERAFQLMKDSASGSSPEVLLAFVERLMKKFDIEAKKIEEREKFSNSLLKEEEKLDNRFAKVKLNYKLRRKRFIIKRQKKLHKQLFKLFKEKVLLEETKTLNRKKSEINKNRAESAVMSKNLQIETQQTDDMVKKLNEPAKKDDE